MLDYKLAKFGLQHMMDFGFNVGDCIFGWLCIYSKFQKIY